MSFRSTEPTACKSATNSTVTLLGVSATYTGSWIDVVRYTSVLAAVKSDVSGTLYMEFSDTDSGSADSSLQYDVAAGFNEVHKLTVTRQYYRVRYVNDSIAQTAFEVTTLLGNHGALTAPANLSMGQDADAIVARVVDGEQDIAEGKRAGYAIVNKFGRNPDIDTGSLPEDIWAGGGVYTGFPVGDDELVTIVSDNVGDAAAGAGAQTVKIYGLDSNGAEIDEIVTMNGTTLVDSVNTYTRLHRAVVQTSGSTNTAFNIGTLTIAHKTTTANIFLAVPPDRNQSQVGCFTIPAGKTGYLRNIHVFIQRSASATAEGGLWVRESGKSPTIQRPFSISQSDSFDNSIYGGIVLPALTDVTVRILTLSTSNTEVTVNFDLIIVTN